MNYSTLDQQVQQITRGFAAERSQRQPRRELDPADFDLLRQAGFPQVALPVARGGLWESASQSVRPLCRVLRTLAGGDSSIALVCSMHPAVLSYWLTAPGELRDSADWNRQCEQIFASVESGCWWGTITSEPGSGGDVARTRSQAKPSGEPFRYAMDGRKHFGSGSGIMSYMVTTAVAEGESEADWFFVDVRDVPWDGSRGMLLVSRWEGQGMIATQSHSFDFERFAATRIAWPGHLAEISARAGGLIGCMFTSVIVGIVDEAMRTAADMIAARKGDPFVQVEWTRAELDYWLIQQAVEGMLRAVEQDADVGSNVLRGKTAVAELSEQVLTRLCRILGGTTFTRRSPFAYWFEDVRALGFLRPPWPLAFQRLGTL